MKITLDLSKLVEDGKITPAEAARLKMLAAHDTGALGINILVGFGVIAVSAGALALMLMTFKTNSLPVMLMGAALFALGFGLTLSRAMQWELLAQICMVIGALMLGGAILYADDGSLRAAIAVTAGLTVAALAARSNLLAALAVISLAGCLGARTGYFHAMYSLSIREPTVTILLFGALALGAYHLSKRLTADYERLAITVARTSVFLVNFGFWIGSLWGDPLALIRRLFASADALADSALWRTDTVIPPAVFSIGWAIALIAVAVWGVQANRRWVVNVAAVFGAIHFYTQWFEKLGASPASVFGAGLLMLAFALAVWRFNKRAEA
jgi:hypothetical protein